VEQLADDPDFAKDVGHERRCEVRYLGQAYEVGVSLEGTDEIDDAAFARLIAEFHDQHERAFAFANRDEVCEIRIQRLSVTATVGEQPSPLVTDAARTRSATRGSVVYRGREIDCLIAQRSDFRPGDRIETPAIVLQEDATTFLPPGVRAEMASTGDLLVTNDSAA
ncbi:MAG: hypothetical protein ACRDL8_17650, partial [Solirubrobacteraceae bacterium]